MTIRYDVWRCSVQRFRRSDDKDRAIVRPSGPVMPMKPITLARYGSMHFRTPIYKDEELIQRNRHRSEQSEPSQAYTISEKTVKRNRLSSVFNFKPAGQLSSQNSDRFTRSTVAICGSSQIRAQDDICYEAYCEQLLQMRG